jgi:hypothetical protein
MRLFHVILWPFSRSFPPEAAPEVTESNAVQIDTTKFSGHETFTLRYGWLTKSVYFVKENPEGFSSDEAMVSLGVGKNMVRSMRHWAIAFGVIEEDPAVKNNRGRYMRVSEFGESIFGEQGFDQYMEDVGTLWLLHYRLASRPDAPTTWLWAFNHFPNLEFTTDQLTGELLRATSKIAAAKVSEETIRRDVNCFVRTYLPTPRSRSVAFEDTLDCPFTELRLLHDVDRTGLLAFTRGDHPSLPTWVFVYCLLDFWGRMGTDVTSLSFADIAYLPSSPGRVFKLSESAVAKHLHAIGAPTKNALTFQSTAGLSQVHRSREIVPSDVLPTRHMALAR